MGSEHLTPQQAERLRAQIERQTDYLVKLIERMRRLRWADDDPLWQPTLNAMYAMVQLRSVAQGIGCASSPMSGDSSSAPSPDKPDAAIA